jgi:folate-binding protein YgfZ
MVAPAALDAGYLAATQAAAWYRPPQPGLLLLGGATRLDYLQRQSTNDLGLLAPNRAVPNILTNPSGRILEVFTLLAFGEQIALLTQPGHAPGLAAYFKKRIFFNDQVTVEDASANWAQLELHGPQAPAALAALGFSTTPTLDEVVTTELSAAGLYAIGEEGCTRLLAPSDLIDQLTSRLSGTGASALTYESRELLRIEAGRAGHPEFTDAYTPFEIGLDRYVSASKGCYTGQEVLARQVTYDKVVRGLAQLAATAPVEPGAAVSRQGKALGQVSSAAVSPQRGPLALAVLRKPFEPGDEVQIGASEPSLTARIL